MTWTRSITIIATLGASELVLGCNGDDSNAPVPPITVTDVSPASGPMAGGTSVTITGTNFTNVTSVSIGGSELGSRTVVSASQITGTTPSSTSPGAKDVVVTSSSHGSATCSGCFSYTEDEPPPTLNLAAIGVGNQHTCGLTREGAAYCWGSSNFGQLGNGTMTSSPLPVPVLGGLSFTALGVNAEHNCGLTATGDAYCWGFNTLAELGIGTTSGPERCGPGRFPCSSVPMPVVGSLSFIAVGAGVANSHTCGLTAEGTAYCWGGNLYGQLGDGTTAGNETCYSGFGLHPCSTIPVAVVGSLSFVSVSAGAGHTCGLTVVGAVYCWGLNGNGQLGDGTTTNRSVPVPVAGGLTFTAVSAGFAHTCGVSGSGAAYCWGANNDGKIGDGTTHERPMPVPVVGGLSFTSVSAGGNSTCGVTTLGRAYCWGQNTEGQLGDGTTQDRSTPMPVVGDLSFTSLSAGGPEHVCGLTASGVAYCWGSNRFGQLGDGTTNNSTVPVRVASNE
jgi:alpha-tubulin suppressor-like RCC1 family protein